MKSCCCGGEIGLLLYFVSKTRGRVPRCAALKRTCIFFPLRNVIGLREEGGESYMTRRKKSQQRAGGECSASARGDKV